MLEFDNLVNIAVVFDGQAGFEIGGGNGHRLSSNSEKITFSLAKHSASEAIRQSARRHTICCYAARGRRRAAFSAVLQAESTPAFPISSGEDSTMFCKKKKNLTKLEKAQEAGTRAIEQVQEALAHLPMEQWQDRLHELKESASDLALRTRSNVSEQAQAAAEKAREAAEYAREEAQDLAGKKEALQETLSGASKLVSSRLRHKSEPMVEAVQSAADQAEAQLPAQNAGFSKWLWLGAGMLAGGLIALVLAPASGRRSRALLRDKLSQGKQHAAEMGRAAGETVSGKVAEVGERIKDAAHEAQEKSAAVQEDLSDATEDDDEADDETIADRVRTALGRDEATRDLERINVSCCDGVVTLHGPHLNDEQKGQVEKVVRAVKGVQDVKNELETEAPETEAKEA
jgi:gas vesicle protein